MAALDGSCYQGFPETRHERAPVPISLSVMMDMGSGSGRKMPNLGAFTDNQDILGQYGQAAGPLSSPMDGRPPSSKPINIRDSPKERPDSALARGVQITDQSDLRVNPEPMPTEEADILLEEYLSPRKLRALTGCENLEDVHYLEMKVDTRDTSLGNFGSHLPNLSQLKLSNSIIANVRDLGSCLESLRVLWMARCGVEQLDGLPSMTSLRELYLAYNEVADISPCGMLDKLQILDLEGNNVDNISEVHFLSQCFKLENLTLEGNPVCVTPSPDEADVTYNYRSMIKSILPHLKLLDDEPLSESLPAAPPRQASSVFEDDWRLIEQLMDEGVMPGAEETVTLDVPARPGTGLKPTTAYRPGSALKPYAVERLRPGTRGGVRQTQTGAGLSTARPGSGYVRGGSGEGSSRGRLNSAESGSRPATTQRLGTADSDSDNEASELTRGVIVCGNPSKALRSRNKMHQPTSLSDVPHIRKQLRHRPEHTHDTVLEDDDNLKEILAELRQWKAGYNAKEAEIAASKAPQVLTIDHDEAEDASGNEVSTDEEDDGYVSRRSEARSPEYSGESSRENSASAGARPKQSSKRRDKSSGRRRLRQYHDESHDVNDDQSPVETPPSPATKPYSSRLRGVKGKSQSSSSIRSPSPAMLLTDDENRPYSGPEAIGPRKYKLDPMDSLRARAAAQPIDRLNPIIRTETITPERFREGPRAGTSRTALMQPPPSIAKIRKGQLTNVQLLPSKSGALPATNKYPVGSGGAPSLRLMQDEIGRKQSGA